MAADTNLTDTQFLNQDPEVLGLQRQRALANLLTGQAFNAPQGQVISGHYVKPSALQQALPMINAAIGGMTNANLDTKQQELAAALRQKQSAQFEQYGQLEQKDKAAALRFALGSDNPTLRDIAKEELKGVKLEKGAIFNKPTLGGAPVTMQGAPDLPHGYNAAAWEQGVDLNSLPLNQRGAVAGRAGEINRILHPGTNVYNNMPPAESEYSKVTGGLIAKRDDALKDAAENAQLSIDNIARQRTVLKSDKVITGFGAEPRLALAQFGQAIGAGGKDSNELVSNTQGLLASRASATLDAIKTSNLGSAQGFSNTDREFLEKAKLGGIKYTAESLNHQLDIEEKLARFSVDKYNNRLKQLPKSASGPLNLQPITLTSPSNVVDYNSLK
jgi:hypothetical protein